MDVQPWLRQPNESAQAYAAFCVYRDLGADRSFVAASQRCGKSVSILSRWSSRWNWVSRVQAYDAYLAIITEEERQKALKEEAGKWAKRQLEEREREWDHALLLYQKASVFLQQPVLKRSLSPKSLSDIAAGLEKAAKLARLAAEMETDRQRIDVAVEKEIEASLDLLHDNLSPDEYAKVIAILAGRSASSEE